MTHPVDLDAFRPRGIADQSGHKRHEPMALAARIVLEQSLDHPQLDADHTPFLTLLDHLHVLPARLWTSASRWSPGAFVLGNVNVDFDHRIVDAAPTVRNRRRGSLWMSPSLQGLEGFC
jgi:hypothetical protein